MGSDSLGTAPTSPPAKGSLHLNAASLSTSERLIGLDIVKLLSFIPITMYHFMGAIWDNHEKQYNQVMPNYPPFWDYVFNGMHVLAFSGLSILFLTIFLMGLIHRREHINWPIIFLLPFGWVLFCWAYFDFQSIFLFWDIYPLIAFGLLLIQLTFRYTKVRAVHAALFGFVFASLPYWEFLDLSSWGQAAEMVLVGNCHSNLASWPIFPWLGFMIMAYGCGQWARERCYLLPDGGTARESAEGTAPTFIGLPMSRKEKIVWAIGLVASIAFWGPYFRVQFEEFDCTIFRQPPWVLWAHMGWILFGIRISLIKSVQDKLKARAAWVSELMSSRNFGFVYFYSFLLGFLINALIGDALRASPFAFTLVLCMIWLFSESTSRLIFAGIHALRQR